MHTKGVERTLKICVLLPGYEGQKLTSRDPIFECRCSRNLRGVLCVRMHGWYNHQHRRGRVNLPLSIVGRFKCTLFQKSRRSRILLHVLGRFARAGEKEMFHHRIHLRLTHTIAYTSTMLASSTTKSSRNRWSVVKEHAIHDEQRGRGSL